MKRSTFISLMLSPLIAPFVPSPKEEVLEFPNGSKIYYYKRDTGTGLANREGIDDHRLDAMRYYMGDRFKNIPFGYHPGVKTDPSAMIALNKINRIT